MKILFTDYNWGKLVVVSSSVQKTDKEVLQEWFFSLRYPRLGEKSKLKILEEINDSNGQESLFTRLIRLKNVSCISFGANGVTMDINIVELSRNCEKTTVIAYYKGGTYISQSGILQSLEAIRHWSRYLSWRYYSKEERAAIRKAVSELQSLNIVIEGLVWKFESFILGNSLEVYIVHL